MKALLSLPVSVTGVDSVFSLTDAMEKKRCATLSPQVFVDRVFLRKHGELPEEADTDEDESEDETA